MNGWCSHIIIKIRLSWVLNETGANCFLMDKGVSLSLWNIACTCNYWTGSFRQRTFLTSQEKSVLAEKYRHVHIQLHMLL